MTVADEKEKIRGLVLQDTIHSKTHINLEIV